MKIRRVSKCVMVLAIALLFTVASAHGQVAVKTNVLYDIATTPNLGVEVGLKGKSSLSLVYGLNPWRLGKNDSGERYAKHWVLMPEYRWWTCSRFNGHFIGAHAFGGEMNVSNINMILPGGFVGGENLVKAAKTERFQGGFFGVGVSYGYQWSLSRHWGVEAEIGAGYGYIKYDRYPCTECGHKISSGHTNYLGVTKLAISAMYIF